MKYSPGKLSHGKWAVFTGKSYFVRTVTTTHEDALYQSLIMSAHWHQAQQDKIHKQLEALGRVNPSDPRGYMA